MNAYEKTLEMLIERLGDAQLELTRASNAYQQHIKYAVLMELDDVVALDTWKRDLSEFNIDLFQAKARVTAIQTAYDLAVDMEDDSVHTRKESGVDETPRYRVLTRNGDDHLFGIWDEESMNYVSFTGVTGLDTTSTMSKAQVEDECARLNAEDKS